MKRRIVVAVFSLPVLVCVLLLCSALHVMPGLLHSECEMTYMYTWPQYQRLNLSLELERAYPQYSLHLYRETRNKVEPTLDWAPLRLSGVPALFIPGNAGSHKQVRSSASIALQMHRREFSSHHHFDFFTVNLNEEFSGLFGGVLHRQTKFVAACVHHIISLYSASCPACPSSVLIIAHSMGGVVAQALLTLPNFPSSLVHTIITLASPLARPVITPDPLLLQFYDSIAETWYNGVGVANVTLISIAGGDSDVQVPPHLTITPSHSYTSLTPNHHPPITTLSIAGSAVPRNWVSADHQAVVWCRRLQLALGRAIFLIQTPPTQQLTSDPRQRGEIFRHLLFTGWKVPMQPDHTQMNSDLWTLVESMPHYREGHSQSVTALSLSSSPSSPSSPSSSHLLVASNTDTGSWLFTCSQPPSPRHAPTPNLANCTDLSPLAKILPPRERVVKYVRLSSRELQGATHVVVVSKRTVGKVVGREFLLMEWCGENRPSLELPLLGSTHLHLSPFSHCTVTTLPISHLTHMWTAHSATVTASCPGVKGGLLLPWLPHTPLLHDNGTGQLDIPISLQVPVPDGVAPPELLLWAPHNCSLSVSLSPSPLSLAGKLLVLYAPLLLPWVTAVALSSPAEGGLLGELAMLAVLWGTTSWGFPPGSDWEQLTSHGLWTVWSPLLIHLVAHGLFQMLSGLLSLLTYLTHLCLPCTLRRLTAILLAALYLPASVMCGAGGLVCVLAAYLLLARERRTCHALSILVCLLGLSLPSLSSWVKNFRYSMQLSPDPLFWPLSMISTFLLLLLLLQEARPSSSPVALGRCGFLSPIPLAPLLPLSPSHLLSLSLLLYAATHTYRLTYFSAASVSLTLATAAVNLYLYRQEIKKNQ